ncbi:MAG: type II toxin-antitoxin system RelE/ParE family toxin [Deltaproteobacteria bacterium]|nr:type II toxin-antitoxin system RelE/ParE family toxin [Deltaproteobacteria bacterium]
MKLRVPDNIEVLIQGMHPDLRKKVRGSLHTILSEPYCGTLPKDELSGLRSFRVSQFRIIYKMSGKHTIDIVAIGPREEIYKETYRIIAKGISRIIATGSYQRAQA